MRNNSFDDMHEILTRLAYNPGKPGDLTGVIQHIADTARDAFTADECTILSLNPITEGFINAITIPANASATKHLLDGEITRDILQKGLLFIEDHENKQVLIGLALRTKHRKRPLGVIYLSFRNAKQLTPEKRGHFQLFAAQASHLLQETWLAHNYEEVTRIGQDINQSLSTINDLFRELHTYTDTILDSSHALLLAVHQVQTDNLTIFWQEQGRFTQFNVPLSGICEYVIATKQTVFIEHYSKNATQYPYRLAHIEGSETKESLIFIPILLLGETLGVLSIQHGLPDAYGQEDLFMLQLLATHTALALHNLRLYNGLNQLNEVGQLLTRHLDSVQTLPKILQATGADIVVLYPYDAQRQKFLLPPSVAGVLIDETSTQKMSSTLPDGITTLVIKNHKPIFARESSKIYNIVDAQVRPDNFQQREKIRSTVTIPLLIGDEEVGVLYINFRQPQRFDAIQKLLIEGIAHFSANALKNAYLFGNLSLRRVRELEMLQYIVNELNRNLDLQSVLKTLLTLAKEQVPADTAAIMLYDPLTGMLEVASVVGDHAEERVNLKVSLKDTKSITRWVLENKRAVRVDNVYRDEPWVHIYFPSTPHTISELDVPLMVNDEVVGVLNFEGSKEAMFRQEDQDFLSTLAGQAVLAIKKAQAYEREKRFAAESQTFNEISKEITSQLNPTSVFALILEKAFALTNSHTGSLEIYDAEKGELWIVAEQGMAMKEGKKLNPYQGLVGYALRHGQVLNINVDDYPWKDMYNKIIPDTRSELVVPMLAGEKVRGIINIESPNRDNFSKRDEDLLKGLADLAVVALQNAERYTKAEREAQRFKLLYRAGQELSEITEWSDRERAYDVTFDIAQDYSQCHVVIRAYEEELQELVVIRTSQELGQSLMNNSKVNNGVNGQVAREKRTIVIGDTFNPSPNIEVSPVIDPQIRSLLITPIKFRDHYYGNLSLSHESTSYFDETDKNFFEALAQQLATTIYRLQATQETQEYEQRALSAEEMTSIGQLAFELTHRLGNDLGLVRTYVDDINTELEKLHVTNLFIQSKLNKIVQATRKVLDLGKALKQVMTRSGEAIISKPVELHPGKLLAKVLKDFEETLLLRSDITINLYVNDETMLYAVPGSIKDILHNIIRNAIEALPDGGTIDLQTRKAGRFMAIDVHDSGGGIPPHILSRVFDLSVSTKGSSGFGLWSARRNALRNKGDLKVESLPGQGTTFILLLPKIDGGMS